MYQGGSLLGLLWRSQDINPSKWSLMLVVAYVATGLHYLDESGSSP
jgi:hypothetical protein